MASLSLFIFTAAVALGAVQNNASLTGTYYFRQVLLVTDGVNVIQTRSGSGTMVFNGTGNFTFTGQQLLDMTPASALTGVYRVSSLEFPGGSLINIRNTNSRLTANGSGAFAETSVTGQARNLGNQLLTQNVGTITYSVSPDATGLLNFAAGSITQLLEGTKSIFVSGDGTYFIGGSLAAGGHGLVVGVRSFVSGATHDSWNGFFHTAGLRFDADRSRLTGTAGSANVVTPGAVWARRTRQSDGLLDASVLLTYSLDSEGSGPFLSTSGQVSLASTGGIFSTSGVAANSTVYELSFGAHMPPVSGPGVFIDPQRVLNSANYGLGYPLSPGGFFTIFGTELASQTVAATPGVTFPTTLGGVSVTVNGTAVPLYLVSPGLIHALVPFAAAGSTATVIVTSNGVPSNAVEAPLAPTAPGIFTLPQNGLGDGATLHADFSVVNAASPARAGEIVQVFLTGMGAVSPTVQDGAPAPATEPFARTVTPLAVTVDGVPCVVHYSGLAPTYAGLYQLNVQLPADLPPGTHSLAIQTLEAFTDMANIESGP